MTGCDVAAAAAQLSRDLAASEQREHDLREQLRFAEQTNATLRRKLTDSDDEMESLSVQLRRLTSTTKRGGVAASKTDADCVDVVDRTQREVEYQLQMDLAEQEMGVLRRKMDVVSVDNENLLTAVKYLRGKLEPASGAAASTSDVQDAVDRLLTGVTRTLSGDDELDRCRDELCRLRQRVTQVELSRAASVDTETTRSKDDTPGSRTKDETPGLQAECERLRRLVDDLQRRQDASTSDTQATDAG